MKSGMALAFENKLMNMMDKGVDKTGEADKLKADVLHAKDAKEKTRTGG